MLTQKRDCWNISCLSRSWIDECCLNKSKTDETYNCIGRSYIHINKCGLSIEVRLMNEFLAKTFALTLGLCMQQCNKITANILKVHLCHVVTTDKHAQKVVLCMHFAKFYPRPPCLYFSQTWDIKFYTYKTCIQVKQCDFLWT